MTTTPAMPEPIDHIKEPYTLAELNERIASNDYNAELLLQHAMLLLNAQPARVSDEDIWRLWDSQDSPELSGGPCPVKFARAILALRPQAVPMTPAERERELDRSPVDTSWEAGDAFMEGIYAAEARHGITAPAGGEKQA